MKQQKEIYEEQFKRLLYSITEDLFKQLNKNTVKDVNNKSAQIFDIKLRIENSNYAFDIKPSFIKSSTNIFSENKELSYRFSMVNIQERIN